MLKIKGEFKMDFLQKLFPMSFQKTEVNNFVKRIIIYAVGIILAGVIGFVVGLINIPILTALVGFIVSLFDLYCTAGIVLAILVHCNVIKLN